ncbi:MAG: hypothetical protein IKX45_05535 [Bacteroidales bacterium]|nr:hypothetical protein [Bacteroidales bacterium]MBR5703695.1 hypothetical protein [Bacteroidales bacterium]
MTSLNHKHYVTPLLALLTGILTILLTTSCRNSFDRLRPYSHEWEAPEIEGSRRALTAEEIGSYLDYPFTVTTDENGEMILSLKTDEYFDPLMGMGIEIAPGVFEYGTYSNYAEFGNHLAEMRFDNPYEGDWRCDIDGGSLIKYSFTDTSVQKVCIKVDRENHLEGETVEYPIVLKEGFSEESAAFADSLENWLNWRFDEKCSLLEESHKLTSDEGEKVIEKKLVIYSPKRFNNLVNGSSIFFDKQCVTVTQEGDLIVFEQELPIVSEKSHED